MNRNLRDKIEMILEDILGSNIVHKIVREQPFSTYKEREEWKNYYRRKIMEAVKETLEDEIKSMAN